MGASDLLPNNTTLMATIIGTGSATVLRQHRGHRCIVGQPPKAKTESRRKNFRTGEISSAGPGPVPEPVRYRRHRKNLLGSDSFPHKDPSTHPLLSTRRPDVGRSSQPPPPAGATHRPVLRGSSRPPMPALGRGREDEGGLWRRRTSVGDAGPAFSPTPRMHHLAGATSRAGANSLVALG